MTASTTTRAELPTALTGPLARWNEAERAAALHPDDVDAIAATAAARALVLERLAETIATRDRYSAAARLGELLASAGASPTLAAGAIDGAAAALGVPVDAAARAACVEGYVKRVRDDADTAARLAWEYPACAVPLDGEPKTVAIACAVPSHDPEIVADWAARVAGALVRDKVRRAVLGGHAGTVAELRSALALVGVGVGVGAKEAPAPRGFRWPWSR